MTPTTTVLTGYEPLLDALQELAGWADEIHLAYAWASSGGGKAHHWRALPPAKLRRAIIGVHFAQTEPYVLRALARYPGVLRVVEDTTGVFHPKVVVGVRGTDGISILGSSNFTQGGFSGNTELNLLLRGSAEHGPVAQILEFIALQWSSPRTFTPDAAWFDRYEIAYGKRPIPRRLARPNGERKIVSEIADLNVGWEAYCELIGAQERRSLANGTEIHLFEHENGSYLEEAERCRAAFARASSFSEMSLADRQLVSGWGSESSGYFGRMTGAGNFKKRVRTQPDSIGHFLDLVPLGGPVPRAVASQCLNGLVSLPGLNIATATRLLCVKRQDLYIPLNGANRHQIWRIFGRVADSVAGYLDLHERIWTLEWVHATRPADATQQRIWAARVALLDALLYEAPDTASPPQGHADPRA